MPRPFDDLTGRSFGSWTVLRRGPDSPTVNETIWTCACSCGKEVDVPRSNLTRGRSTQCTACRALAMKKPPRPKPKGRGRNHLLGVRTSAHPRWRGNLIVYSSAHKRVVAARGRAAEYPCVDCGAQARDWSREKVDCDTRQVDPKKGPYCTHSEHYSPRCRDCHNRFDHP